MVIATKLITWATTINIYSFGIALTALLNVKYYVITNTKSSVELIAYLEAVLLINIFTEVKHMFLKWSYVFNRVHTYIMILRWLYGLILYKK